ncbi:MAG: zinc-binding dehydrogenase, partial [Phyllobacteriaceae bacterium]|nr:zinc-binding dehydrogenase [Phyllobacteriaceae bacterium]
RPTLFSYTSTDVDFRETAEDLVEIVKSGKVRMPINQRYKLSDAGQAHRDLESRKTTGTTVLLP